MWRPNPACSHAAQEGFASSRQTRPRSSAGSPPGTLMLPIPALPAMAPIRQGGALRADRRAVVAFALVLLVLVLVLVGSDCRTLSLYRRTVVQLSDCCRTALPLCARSAGYPGPTAACTLPSPLHCGSRRISRGSGGASHHPWLLFGALRTPWCGYLDRARGMRQALPPFLRVSHWPSWPSQGLRRAPLRSHPP